MYHAHKKLVLACHIKFTYTQNCISILTHNLAVTGLPLLTDAHIAITIHCSTLSWNENFQFLLAGVINLGQVKVATLSHLNMILFLEVINHHLL